MGGLLMFVFHGFAVYVGTQVAQLEYPDFWRACIVALLSYVVMFVLTLVLLPLAFVPLVNQLLGVAILGLGTAFAAKMVLACDWQPAWIIGATATVLNALV